VLDALRTGKLEKCCMMPLLYWNKEDVSIEIGTLAILNGPCVNVPSVLQMHGEEII